MLRAMHVRPQETEPRKPMHWMTRIGVAGVILCIFVVIALNAIGWVTSLPGPAGIAAAAVAVTFELIALVGWEHVMAWWRARQWGNLFVAAIGLSLAVGMNIEGGHRGLDHIAQPLREQADAERKTSQDSVDQTRRELEQSIATLQGRVDAVAATNPGVTYPGRMAEWRANFDLVTADDRRQITALRAQLDSLPLAVVYSAPYPTWGPYAVAGVFAFISLFGLTMFGVKVPGPGVEPRVTPQPAPAFTQDSGELWVAPQNPPGIAPEPRGEAPVIPLTHTEESLKEWALRLRACNWSQERVASHLSQETGARITRDKVRTWEGYKRPPKKPNATDAPSKLELVQTEQAA